MFNQVRPGLIRVIRLPYQDPSSMIQHHA